MPADYCRTQDGGVKYLQSKGYRIYQKSADIIALLIWPIEILIGRLIWPIKRLGIDGREILPTVHGKMW